MALTTVSSDRLSTNVKNTNFTSAEKQDLTNDILPLAGELGSRNLIQNGSFIIHQRGGTSTAQGFLLDRWYAGHGQGTTTISQGTETSGTVYEKGLVNYYRITNTANSTASNAYRYLRQSIEAQNLLKSGWNYKSASAKITLSFYVRSSVAQNFYGYLRLSDSPDSKYVFETGSLTADTWTKVTKVIPGYASGNIDNNNGSGMEVLIAPFWGTDSTASGVALNTWAAWNGGERAPDYATTWAGTNGATFDVTGVQLEVGSVATDFEHRSFAQELALCQRYFYKIIGTSDDMAAIGFAQSSSDNYFNMEFPVPMRDYPTLTGSATPARFFSSNNGQDFNLNAMSLSSNMTNANPKRVMLYVSQAGTAGGLGGALHFQNQEGFLSFSAEL